MSEYEAHILVLWRIRISFLYICKQKIDREEYEDREKFHVRKGISV